MISLQDRSRHLSISDSSQVGDARRVAAGLAEAVGLNATQKGQVSIIATELANNILKHAQRGEIILRTIQQGGRRGVELLSLDHGPGMADVEKCLQDGYSTAGSCGTGLGSISRLSTRFDIYSVPQQGTVILAEVLEMGKETPSGFEAGAICLPMHEGEGCGDAWSARSAGESVEILMVDGLGHGEFAAMAADEAVRIFQENKNPDLVEQMQYLHGALKKTRGAAVALARLDAGRRQLSYVGLGNIAGCIVTGEQSRSLLSQNGTVGHVMERVREFTYDWSPESRLVMHSDGLTTKWDLQKYPGLQSRRPAVVAGVLFRDCRRQRDDASVLVLREAARKAK